LNVIKITFDKFLEVISELSIELVSHSAELGAQPFYTDQIQGTRWPFRARIYLSRHLPSAHKTLTPGNQVTSHPIIDLPSVSGYLRHISPQKRINFLGPEDIARR
jgi:hypothetical protein